jgi:MFS family permease
VLKLLNVKVSYDHWRQRANGVDHAHKNNWRVVGLDMESTLRLTSGPETGERPWAPLQYEIFRWLWIASLVSHLGTWMQNVGAGWLMTILHSSPLYVSLITTATSLPVFLLGVPAGAAADIVDRRRLLIFTQGFMLAAAGMLAFFTAAGRATPFVLLLTTFALGVGSTLNDPAWQAIVPELVPRHELANAVSLNSVAFNLARAAGPALGGFLIAAFSPAAVFFLNALSFVGVIFVIWRWKRPTAAQSAAASERIVQAAWAGLRYVRYSPGMSNVLVRVGTFIIGGSATWCILPIVTEQELHGTATGYGVLLGCIGSGAVLGAFLLAKFRQRFSPDQIVIAAGILWGLATLSLGFVKSFPLASLAMFAGGVAWVSETSSFNVAAQTVLPAWVRARALSVYLLVFQGGMAISSVVWGSLADRYGIRTSFIVAGTVLLLTPLLAKWFPLREGEERDITISPRWPEPVFKTPPDPERGPVLVQVEYLVSLQDSTAFTQAIQELGRIRRRDGAIRWGIFEDAAVPGRFIESFLVENWAEYLRQHERMTLADSEIEMEIQRFHRGPEPPRIGHLLAAV